MNTIDTNKGNKIQKLECSPFDDPIVGACFASVETAGKAIQSFCWIRYLNIRHKFTGENLRPPNTIGWKKAARCRSG